MLIDIACPNCRGRFRVEDRHAGKTVKCKKCGTSITIPPPVSSDDGGYDLSALQAAADQERSAPPAAPPPIEREYEPAPRPRPAARPPSQGLSRPQPRDPNDTYKERESIWAHPAMQQVDGWIVRAGVLATIASVAWPLYKVWRDYFSFKLPPNTPPDVASKINHLISKYMVIGTLREIAMIVVLSILAFMTIAFIGKIAEALRSPMPDSPFIRIFATLGAPILIFRALFTAMMTDPVIPRFGPGAYGFNEPSQTGAILGAGSVALIVWIALFILFFRFSPKLMGIAIGVAVVILGLGSWGAGALFKQFDQWMIGSMMQESRELRESIRTR